MSKKADRDLVYAVPSYSKYLWSKSEDTARQQIPKKHFEHGWNLLTRELFARLYNLTDLEKVERPTAWAEAVHEAAEEVSDWHGLRKTCARQYLHSVAASISLAKELAEKIEPPEEQEKLRQALEALGKNADQAQVEQLLQQIQKKFEEWRKKYPHDTVRQIFRQATQAAKEATKQAQQIVETFGIEPGTFTSGDPTAIIPLYEAVINNPQVYAVVEQAGRLRRIALHKQATKADRAANEITSIEQGQDISRTLAQELVYLRDPKAKLLFYKKFLERQLLQYKLSDNENLGRGPIIVLVDRSGSMSKNKRLAWAKAFALAILEIAKIQKRPFALAFFDAKLAQKFEWPEPTKVAFADLLEALKIEASGGTAFDPPFTFALELLKKSVWSRADIILITDGVASLSQQAQSEINAARSKGLQVFAIVISGTFGVLEKICDQIYTGYELATAEQEILAL